MDIKDEYLENQLNIFNHFLHYNHVQESGGGASFNPCSLLMFTPKTNNPLIDSIIFSHEYTHARLSSCTYGKIVFLFRYISIDLIRFHIEEETRDNFKDTWKIYIEFERIISKLVTNWVICQEGYATFVEHRTLGQIIDPKLNPFKESFNKFISVDTPYSKGLKQFLILSNYFSIDNLRNIAHEIGNLDFTSFLPELISNTNGLSNELLPDAILMQLTEKLVEYKKERIVVVSKDRDALSANRESGFPIAFTRTILFDNLKTKIDFFNTDNRNLFEDVINIILKNAYLGNYRETLQSILGNYLNEIENLYSTGGTEQLLAYPSKKELVNGFEEITISNKNVSFEEKAHINYLNNVYILVGKYLPSNQDLFSLEYAKLINVYSSNKSNKFLTRIFPPTQVEKYRFYRHKNIYKNNYSINNNFFQMLQQIDIKCSKEQAEALIKELQEIDPTISIDLPNNNGEFKHWSEIANVVITIIASSITIIDTLKKWLEKPKPEQVIIIINKTEYINNNDSDDKPVMIELDEVKKMIPEKLD